MAKTCRTAAVVSKCYTDSSSLALWRRPTQADQALTKQVKRLISFHEVFKAVPS